MTKTTLFKNALLVGYSANTTYDIIVKDGIVAAIQPSGEIQHVKTDDVVDVQKLDSPWVSPSLIDWHTHTKLNALHSRRLDLQKATSVQQVLDQVAAAIHDPKFAPTYNANFCAINLRNAGWQDPERLTREALDKISTERPIFLFFNGYHSICCNSRGLEHAGHKADGHSGYVYEDEAFAMFQVINNVDENAIDDWICKESEYAASLGVTEIVDLEWDFGIRSWKRRYDKGFRSLRVHVGMYTEHLQYAIDRGYKTGDDVVGCGGLIKVGPFKVVTDGSLGSQTAYCHDHYPGLPDNFGMLAYKPEALGELIKRGTENGFRMAIHAIGDHANQLTLQALARAEKKVLPGSTIEHAQLLSFEDLPLFRSLGVIASIQPCHLVDDRELCHRFWPGREHRAYPFRWLVDAGVPIKMGSDCPVAPLQPWEAIAVAITRAGSGDERNPFCKEQIIDLEVAWAASTSNGKKKLEVGDRADIVILKANPLECDAAGLRAMKVSGTMLGGDWTYKAF
nr:amidohydrolase 3 [Cryptococcus depauperatus CBS 7841]